MNYSKPKTSYIAISVPLATQLKDPKAVVFTSLLFYHVDASLAEWVPLNDKFFESFGLSEYDCNRIRNKLKELELIETSRKKFNGVPTMHYQINREKLVKMSEGN